MPANVRYPLETVQHLDSLICAIIRQREGELRQAKEGGTVGAGTTRNPLETMQHLGELVCEIIGQRESELSRLAAESCRTTADARHTQQQTLHCWRNAQKRLASMPLHRRDFGRCRQ